jgi:hypothetical protein
MKRKAGSRTRPRWNWFFTKPEELLQQSSAPGRSVNFVHDARGLVAELEWHPAALGAVSCLSCDSLSGFGVGLRTRRLASIKGSLEFPHLISQQRGFFNPGCWPHSLSSSTRG